MWSQFLLISLSLNICLADLPGIIRPCFLNDYKCIGDNLAANSKCNPKVSGKLPAEFIIKSFYFDAPAFNSSYIDKDLFVKNMDKCYVKEFFVNTNTGQVVLGFECPYMELESDRTYIQHRTFQEDNYYYYHIKANYPLLRFTVNLPSVNHMDLCSASIFSDVTILPRLNIDPKTKSTGNALSHDRSYLDIYERENFNSRGRPITFLFVDTMICDYGCPLPK